MACVGGSVPYRRAMRYFDRTGAAARRFVLALLVLPATMAVAAPAQAGEGEKEAPPTGTWSVERDVAGCRLSLSFASTSHGAVSLGISRHFITDALIWTLAGDGLPGYPAAAQLDVALYPQGRSFAFAPSSQSSIEPPRRSVSWLDDGEAMTRLVQDDQRLRVSAHNGLDIALQLPGAKSALADMQHCREARLAEWGIDLDQYRSIKSKPEPIDPARWFTNDDYPEKELKKRIQGAVIFLLTISARGEATGCRVIGTSGSAGLDNYSCNLAMQRSAFRPARDGAGQPVPSHFINRIAWDIPR